VDWATELVREYEANAGKGRGAFTFRGSMIDRPLLLQAKNIVRLNDLIERGHE